MILGRHICFQSWPCYVCTSTSSEAPHTSDIYLNSSSTKGHHLNKSIALDFCMVYFRTGIRKHCLVFVWTEWNILKMRIVLKYCRIGIKISSNVFATRNTAFVIGLFVFYWIITTRIVLLTYQSRAGVATCRPNVSRTGHAQPSSAKGENVAKHHVMATWSRASGMTYKNYKQ